MKPAKIIGLSLVFACLIAATLFYIAHQEPAVTEIWPGHYVPPEPEPVTADTVWEHEQEVTFYMECGLTHTQAERMVDSIYADISKP